MANHVLLLIMGGLVNQIGPDSESIKRFGINCDSTVAFTMKGPKKQKPSVCQPTGHNAFWSSLEFKCGHLKFIEDKVPGDCQKFVMSK